MMGGPGSGKAPRQYPQGVIDGICGMYEAGMTVAELRAAVKGVRVQTILERYLPERRAAAKRDQRGEANHMWRGEDCGYQAAHLRVAAVKGAANLHPCVDCHGVADEWSYVHGCPDERRRGHRSPFCLHADHYEPRCRRCHKVYDRIGGDAHV